MDTCLPPMTCYCRATEQHGVRIPVEDQPGPLLSQKQKGYLWVGRAHAGAERLR
jgi:hypothetical protein